jgi:hypothetical protein
LDGAIGDEIHYLEECPLGRTGKILSRTVDMEKHVGKAGGFQGQDRCSSCGIPRAICERWEVRAGGGWGEVPQRPCQYTGILIPAVITMIEYRHPEGRGAAKSWMDEGGVRETKPDEEFE